MPRRVTWTVSSLAGRIAPELADIREPGRISDAESEREFYSEEAYREMVKNAGRRPRQLGRCPRGTGLMCI
jgi:hypothetical protein